MMEKNYSPDRRAKGTVEVTGGFPYVDGVLDELGILLRWNMRKLSI
jgi:hypothetical protein